MDLPCDIAHFGIYVFLLSYSHVNFLILTYLVAGCRWWNTEAALTVPDIRHRSSGNLRNAPNRPVTIGRGPFALSSIISGDGLSNEIYLDDDLSRSYVFYSFSRKGFIFVRFVFVRLRK